VERLEALSTPLSVRQYRILDRVDQGITSLGRLAELARRQPSTVSKSADSLVRQGLLTRKEATEDRRAMVLALTPAGARLLAEARASSGDLAAWLVEASGMRPAELGSFAEALYEQTEELMDSPGRPAPPAQPAGPGRGGLAAAAQE